MDIDEPTSLDTAPAARVTPAHPASKPAQAIKWFWGTVLLQYDDHRVRVAAGKPDVICVVCGKELKYNGSTGNAEKHANQHPEHMPAKNALGPIERHMTYTPSFKQYVVRWIVDTYQPLSVVERESFKSMIRAINPKVIVPSRAQVTAWLDDFEEMARAFIQKSLVDEDVSLTSDAWTSSVQEAFLALTAHYINSLWLQVHALFRLHRDHQFGAVSVLSLSRLRRDFNHDAQQ
jgi:hypothetical protein